MNSFVGRYRLLRVMLASTIALRSAKPLQFAQSIITIVLWPPHHLLISCSFSLRLLPTLPLRLSDRRRQRICIQRRVYLPSKLSQFEFAIFCVHGKKTNRNFLRRPGTALAYVSTERLKTQRAITLQGPPTTLYPSRVAFPTVDVDINSWEGNHCQQ